MIDGSRKVPSIHGKVVHNNVFCCLWGLVWEVRCTCCSSVVSNTTVRYYGLCPPSKRRLSSRPLVTAWSIGSSGIAGRVSLSSGFFDWKSLFILSVSHATSLHVFWWLFSLSLACTRAAVPTLFEFLLCTVCHEASTKCGNPSFLVWLCTSLSAGVPRLRHVWWSLLALFHSRAWSTSGTDSSAAHLCCGELFTLSFSFSHARLLSFWDLQHRTWRLRRGRVSAGSGPCCVSSSASSVPILALVELRQFSAQPWSTPETLRHHIDKKFPGCPHSTWDVSCRTRDRNSASFRTEITRSLCNWASVSISKGWNTILLVTEMI